MTTVPAPSNRKAEEHASFFRPYKPGQGFWTRLGTGLGAALIILFTIQFLFRRLPVWTPMDRSGWPLYVILGILCLAMVGVAWWLINRPRNAEFLINTDVEMKKVNWTSRRELIGSTKVVVIFMFLIAATLFLYDIIFGYFFFFIDVLKIAPFTA